MKFLIYILALHLVGVNAFSQSWKKVKEELIVVNPEFNACHASTIVELRGGKIMAAWFAGAHEGNKDVQIFTSTLENNKWSKPVAVANGIINDTLRYPTWNPVLFKTSDQALQLYYKVGPNPREWWGMYITSDDEGATWSKPERLPNGILGPIKNKPIELNDGTIISPSSTETETAWRSHIERSTDNGKTWIYIPIDTSGKSEVIQPAILTYSNKLQALCRSKQGYVMQSWSTDEGQTWSKLTPTNLINPNSGIDAVSLKDGRHLIVYNPDVPGKEWFNGRAKLRVATSMDGEHWKDIAILENGTKEEFSYPAIIQSSDGKVHITYTFDRKNIKHVVLSDK